MKEYAKFIGSQWEKSAEFDDFFFLCVYNKDNEIMLIEYVT